MPRILFITPHIGGGIGKAIIGLSEVIGKWNIYSEIVLLGEPEKLELVSAAEETGVSILTASSSISIIASMKR